MAFVVVSVALSSEGVDYPPSFQILRGGVAVILDDWARVPMSSTTPDTYPPPVNYREKLSRASVTRFEPGRGCCGGWVGSAPRRPGPGRQQGKASSWQRHSWCYRFRFGTCRILEPPE